MYKKPKDDHKYEWTNHVVRKMAYYGISESLIKRITRFPKRIEVGIAPGTIACMQPAGSKKQPSEVWVMYRSMAEVAVDLASKSPSPLLFRAKDRFNIWIGTSKKLIITAWRYPGASPIGEPIPIPEDILDEVSQG